MSKFAFLWLFSPPELCLYIYYTINIPFRLCSAKINKLTAFNLTSLGTYSFN